MSAPFAQRLYLLRHFHASPPMPGQSDFQRDLDTRGMLQARSLLAKTGTAGLEFSKVFSSPSARTRATLRGMGIAEDDSRIEFVDALYDADEAVYYDLTCQGVQDGTLIVGHNPGMEDFLISLCREVDGVPPAMAGGLSTGVLAVLQVPRLAGAMRPGAARLEKLLLPDIA
ncbi:SixA phosphatase family protein [Aureimonas fodinaquatilis]|nr:histidine phosphatase family protein [Aureimonas fodinaquatilis]